METKNPSKTIAAILVAGLLGSGLFCTQALAAGPITGSIDFGGVVTYDTTSLATATRINIWNSSFVLQDSGSFSGIASGTNAAMAAPWIFNSGTPAVPTPGPATPSLWSVGGFTFDLSSSAVVSQSANFLNVTGVGTASGNGFNATPGTWSFTSSNANGSNSTSFGFQAQTQVPESSTAALFITGAVSLAGNLLLRRRGRAA